MPDRLNHAAVPTGPRSGRPRTFGSVRRVVRRTGFAGVLVGVFATVAHVPGVLAQTPLPPVQSSGRLLYETHCIACHDRQVHWRDGRHAIDWRTLDAQVRRWQATALLNWNEADITAVTRYLNETIYRFPQTGDRLSHSVPLQTVSKSFNPTM
jgi:hypothetical protein